MPSYAQMRLSNRVRSTSMFGAHVYKCASLALFRDIPADGYYFDGRCLMLTAFICSLWTAKR
jgi:hypothetical protein